ncbi:uncharacterized protein [Parasteatoda tepidariorum]|nr:uncharacterized protein LOC107447324 [Parasteatoda tepidariorum]
MNAAMKSAFCFLFLAATVSHCGATLLAATGYWAASNPVRQYFLESGIGDAIGQSAKTMYETSGFRYISDQGTRIRRAQMRNRTIAEMKFAEVQKRKGYMAKTLSQNDDRNFSERLFNVLNEMEKNTCVKRLLCEIGAEPSKFGTIGLQVTKYILSIPPVTWNSLTFSYKEAFETGLQNGDEVCLQIYSNCSYNLYKAVSFLWFIINPLKL